MANLTDVDADELSSRRAFLRSVKASRLMTGAELDQFVADNPGLSLPELRLQLMEAGWLTPFQLRRIDDRETDKLVVGQYQVRELLGQGGFGDVYLARHTLMKRPVALKLISARWAQDRSGRELFLREVAGCTQLSHPNIALPYDAGEHDGTLYLAMEYVAGPTLEAYVTAAGPLPPAAVRRLLVQVAAALDHAYGCGIVHRDLKPANLLLAGSTDPAEFTIKVIDFGLARFLDRTRAPVSTLVCETGALVGTPAFMAPEQADNVHTADIRSDLYSLGTTAYFAATGRLPFSGRTCAEVIGAARFGSPIPLSRLRPDLPSYLSATIHRLMARDPADRFQTPEELLSVLTAGAAQPFMAMPETDWSDPPDARPDAPQSGLPPPPAALDTPSHEEDPIELVRSPVETAWNGSWRGWAGVVDQLADGEPLRLTESEYCTLQRAVLRGANALPAAVYSQVVAVVEPWPQLRTLTALDPRTLADLLAVVRRLDAELTSDCQGGDGARQSVTPVVVVLLVALIAGFIGLWLFGRHTGKV